MLELTQGMFGAADPEYMGDMSDPFDDRRVGTIDGLPGVLQRAVRGPARRTRPTTSRRSSPTARSTAARSGRPRELWYYIIVATAGHDTTQLRPLAAAWPQLLRHPDQVRDAAGRPGAGAQRGGGDDPVDLAGADVPALRPGGHRGRRACRSPRASGCCCRTRRPTATRTVFERRR